MRETSTGLGSVRVKPADRGLGEITPGLHPDSVPGFLADLWSGVGTCHEALLSQWPVESPVFWPLG